MESHSQTNSRRLNPWVLRLPMAIVLLALMVGLAGRVEGLGPALIYLSGWVIVPHVFLGVWVFVRHLRAMTPAHNVLDILAFVFICIGLVSFRSTPAWCAWFGTAFIVAIVKYAMVARTELPPAFIHYARSKIRLESPAVVLFFLAAFIGWRLPDDSPVLRIIEIAILLASAGFAVYMIVVRRAYHKIAKASKEQA